MLTKKDFINAAARVAAVADLETREQLAATLVGTFKASNGRFDEGRFLTACGLVPAQPKKVRRS